MRCVGERVEGREEMRLLAGHLIKPSQWQSCKLKGGSARCICALLLLVPPASRFRETIPPPGHLLFRIVNIDGKQRAAALARVPCC